MIDEEAFERLHLTDQVSAKRALAILGVLGVFTIQQQIEHEKLLAGSTDEPPIQVAHRVIKYREVSTHLQTLSALSEQFEKELRDA